MHYEFLTSKDAVYPTIYIDSAIDKDTEVFLDRGAVYAYVNPPLNDILSSKIAGVKRFVFVSNGYEGKRNILKNLSNYYNRMNMNCFIIFAVLKKKGANSFKSLLPSIFPKVEISIINDYFLFKIIKTDESKIVLPNEDTDNHFVGNYCDISIEFTSEQGMFSSEKIDAGSEFIVQTINSKELIEPKSMVLDFGCGYGAMALPLAKKHLSSQFFLIDNNSRCLAFAQKNAEANAITNCNFIHSEGLNAFDPSIRFNLIMSHFPMHINSEIKKNILKQCEHHLKTGGHLVLVMLSKYFFERLVGDGFSLIDTWKSKTDPEYVVYIYRKTG